MFTHYEMAQLRVADLIREADHQRLINQTKRARAAGRSRAAKRGRNRFLGQSWSAHIVRLAAAAFSFPGGTR